MPGLNFNHAMIYSRDVAAGSEFYQRLGFEVLDVFDHNGMQVYARLGAPEGEGTIALHLLERGKELQPGAIRLYFEARNLDAVCKRLEKAGVVFTKPAAMMPWGWKHAYLNDPDGHEVSLYWAGSKRRKKSR
jgi:catechol 2,3-dioxygenase-like lactoylglutathione lyase family enzyme